MDRVERESREKHEMISIFEEEIPVNRCFRRFPRATKHPLQCLFVRVLWSASLNVPHTKGDIAIRDYNNRVFVVCIAVGEINVLHNSVDESRRELGSTGILDSTFEVRRQPYGDIRHRCLDFEVEFERREAPTLYVTNCDAFQREAEAYNSRL